MRLGAGAYAMALTQPRVRYRASNRRRWAIERDERSTAGRVGFGAALVVDLRRIARPSFDAYTFDVEMHVAAGLTGDRWFRPGWLSVADRLMFAT